MNIANFFQGFVFLAWLAVVAVALMFVTRLTRGQPTRNLGTILGVMVLLAVILTPISAGLVFINPQERGVVISALAPNGYRENALQPGLRFVVPFAEQIERYPVSRQTYTMSGVLDEGQRTGEDAIQARTKDGQEITIDASVIYYINPERVVQVHIDWQNRYTEELVRPLVRGVIRDGVSQFGVEEVYSTRRGELSEWITENLSQRMADNGLTLQEFILRNITFSQEYAASVEQKQIAEQRAEQARFTVEQRRQEAEQARQEAQGRADSAVIAAKGDAEARLIQAEAEAQALELLAGALADNPDLLNYQYINKLAPSLQVMMVPGNTPFLLPFPGMNQAGTQQPTTGSGGTTTNDSAPALPQPTPSEPEPTPTSAP